MIAKKKIRKKPKGRVMLKEESLHSTKHAKQKLDSEFVVRGIDFKNVLANPKILGSRFYCSCCCDNNLR